MVYSILRKLLSGIEQTLPENPTIGQLSDSLSVSPTHLRRLFKATFETPLASYIRSRRLALSLDMLFNTELGIIDIAVECGFDHTQSYIRAFRKEFGLTPGEVRKTGQIVKIKPPLQLFPSNQLAGDVLFGPEIVHIPKFHCIGRRHTMPKDAWSVLLARTGRDFWLNDRDKIPNTHGPAVYIGLTMFPKEKTDYMFYIPSVRVSNYSEVPDGLEGNTIPSCLCARFRYVGEHRPEDINRDISKGMVDAVSTFDNDKEARYGLLHNAMHIEMITRIGVRRNIVWQIEWFAPVYEKK